MNLIKAQRDALLKPLQTVTGIVERRHTLPILSNVLINKTGAQVSFCSTDIEMQIKTQSEMGSGTDDLATIKKALERSPQMGIDLPILQSKRGMPASISLMLAIDKKSFFREKPFLSSSDFYRSLMILSPLNLRQTRHDSNSTKLN